MAHKKYYCSSSAKSGVPAPVQVTSDTEEEEPVAGPAPKVKLEGGSPTPPGPSKTPASSTGLASPSHSDHITKELKLVKPQDLLAEPPAGIILPGLAGNHFVCDGCGIKFKSVSNLQAHQARYCAGLRKSEDQAPIEAAAGAKRHHQPKQSRISPVQLPPPLTAADMINFLSAKSIEQQLAVAAAAQAAAALVVTKDKPTHHSMVAVASALAGSSAGSRL